MGYAQRLRQGGFDGYGKSSRTRSGIGSGVRGATRTAISTPSRRALGDEPRLANATWDWGGGDWESALGAAGHMGRRDIAELLLAHGARLDLFVAAMLGEVEVVRAILDAASRDAGLEAAARLRATPRRR